MFSKPDDSDPFLTNVCRLDWIESNPSKCRIIEIALYATEVPILDPLWRFQAGVECVK